MHLDQQKEKPNKIKLDVNFKIGEGNGNPLREYSGLENPMDGGAW